MKSFFKKVSWPTVIVALVLVYLIWQVDDLREQFTSKNKFFG